MHCCLHGQDGSDEPSPPAVTKEQLNPYHVSPNPTCPSNQAQDVQVYSSEGDCMTKLAPGSEIRAIKVTQPGKQWHHIKVIK
jgi:hypothetical protein